ncbi:CP1 [Symbiodinium natans]|uniref:CP1 protein n=1 Tax=Symbiodinium natans TaxID=878477 RepID=A0A812TKJ4_9DINO|nr:CP1 [Symbiodinium natans]
MQLFFAALVSVAVAVSVKDGGFQVSFPKDRVPGNHIAAFHSFIDQHGKNYKKGTHEYSKRLTIFSDRLHRAEAINSRPGRLWTAGVSPLADLTPEELSQKKGWAGFASPTRGMGRGTRTSVSLLQSTQLPEQFLDWTNLQIMKGKDQGGCGSCWAVTAATVLEAHREIYEGKTEPLSAQQLVNCVQNPRSCGGSGGCKGATVELAMAYTMRHGLSTEEKVPYTGTDEDCHTGAVSTLQLSDQDDLADAGLRRAEGDSQGFMSLGIRGWEKLPENEYLPLMRALYHHGPVAVSVSASSWDLYMNGIFDYCDKNAIIDHAVVLVGYGRDQQVGKKYWTILNSWGQNFGEEGKIRLLRDDKEEENWCGVDSQPELGTGCVGGPSAVRVCGMCGILYDTVVPHFRHRNSSSSVIS